MHIQIKRAGWFLIIGVTLATCANQVVKHTNWSPEELPSYEKRGIRIQKGKAVHEASAADLALVARADATIHNGGFEEGTEPLCPEQHDTLVSGDIGKHWVNISTGELKASCALDSDQKRRGASSQRITIYSNTAGAVSLAQPLRLQEGHTYRFHVWARASRPDTINIGIRMRGSPYQFYNKDTVKPIGTTWTEITGNCPITDHHYRFSYFVAECNNPGVTYWLDDISLEETNCPRVALSSRRAR